ncbi:DUF72 domain-containing protein [Psychrobacter sp. I-STPA10]|uniref:DUF72 domain-containing protein n=1 Tax=Psychrobacter sp. I-STPA10 TaxID=2585769 RepID=UPI001E5F3AF9|nr:DUF72 domain-containing protein [Psychrobacter sp. I-STPA10]
MMNNPTQKIYIGTGGYSDTDLLGTLYPTGTKKSDFLTHYANHYGAVEINSTFYAPIGQKAIAGMLQKSQDFSTILSNQPLPDLFADSPTDITPSTTTDSVNSKKPPLKFALKLHQDFTHVRSHTDDSITKHAQAFLNILSPLIEADCLAPLLLQFPHGFDRTRENRLYLAQLVQYFAGVELAIEFRHASWHVAQVEDSFVKQGLIWCSVDYPKVNGLPNSRFLLTKRTGYLRLHGNNLNWWDAKSASERHDYRYTQIEMQGWANTIANQRQHFDTLYIFFQNTTKAHSYYNIQMLTKELINLGFEVL